MKEHISKRSHGYKRRTEALSRKPDAVSLMVERALYAGFTADYVLMDSWFTQAPLLRQLTAHGLDVIETSYVIYRLMSGSLRRYQRISDRMFIEQEKLSQVQYELG